MHVWFWLGAQIWGPDSGPEFGARFGARIRGPDLGPGSGSWIWNDLKSESYWKFLTGITQEVLGVTFARDVPERLDIARDRVTTLTTR